MTQFQREQCGRLRIHVLPTSQFKTFALSLYIGIPLAEQTVTNFALLPFVLRRGTVRYPETKALRERLDELYGAGFGFDIYKRGNNQIVQFRMDTIQDQFVKNGTSSLLEQSLQYLGEVLTSPITENGAFRQKYLNAEKQTLLTRQQAIVNDKIRYAAERCIAEMFRDDPYRLHALGQRAEVESIDASSLFAFYKEMLQNASMDLYVSGQTSMEQVKPLVEKYLDLPGQPILYKPNKIAKTARTQVQHITEKMDINQGKLNLGLRTGVMYQSSDYATALVFNGILGAYPHSKLFMNVREKASLAYYVSSRLEGHKGFMTIQSGIQFDNAEQAIVIIQQQLEAIRNGEISDLEWNQTLSMLTNQLRETEDAAFDMISFDFNNILSGSNRTVASFIQEIENVRVEDVKRFAHQVELDTVYFLRDNEGGDHQHEAE